MVEYERILAELRTAAVGKVELAETVSLYAELLGAQSRVVTSERPWELGLDEATSRLDNGLPLFPPEALVPDPAAFGRTCEEVCTIAAGQRPDLAAQLDAIHSWLACQSESIPTIVAEFLSSGSATGNEDGRLSQDLIDFVLINALRPFLRARAASFTSQFAAQWYRSRCPVCGGEPDFAALGRENGARQLLCCRCDAEWNFPRVACPFCGEGGHTSYYLSADGVYRLYACNTCLRYLKTIDLRQVVGERLLPVERILTVAMDVAAREAGYH